MLSHKQDLRGTDLSSAHHALTYGSRYTREPVPKYVMPVQGLPAEVAYRVIHDELNLDGNPSLNLATFVTTWMDDHAGRLMAETLSKNYIDQDEYPQTTEIQNYCVNMLARLFNAPEGEGGEAVGTGTVGSSEAIHLAGLAMKWRWRKRREVLKMDAGKPNLVMGANVQVVWEKFARYFEVEPRYVKLTKDRYVIGVEEAMAMVDENTIGVVGILGSTYTGEYEPIEALNDALEELNVKKGWEVPLHVDAASGGFVVPFTQPQLRWDFRLKWVKSINVSGHKYGLVYPGVGWVVWRDKAELPEDLVFHVNYLGGDQPTFNLNFSKGASQVLGQYYNFLFLGMDGYRAVMTSLHGIAERITSAVEGMGRFWMLSKLGHLPVVAFALNDDVMKKYGYTVFDLSEKLRERGWIVPAYTMAPDAEGIALLRVVVRESMSRDMADLFVADLQRAVEHFEHEKSQHSKQEEKRKGPQTRGVC
ncbi:glutamate decarboxylase [Poriferisphaera sp. WC338]|uniref:glutamate decarboxylase n=1 Tax=Poriferisphaera sp. WC338 TaxID=3425129 RepID=UPI003D8176C3